MEPRQDASSQSRDLTINTKLMLLGALCALFGLAIQASGQTAGPSGRGLNGQNYVSLTYLYTDIDDGPPGYYEGVGFRVNHAFWPGIDLILTGGNTWSERIAGTRGRSRDVDVGVRWHSTRTWGRPFFEATLGGTWFDYGNFEESSWTYAAGLGAEFQVTEQLSLTPMVGYSDAPDYDDAGDPFLLLRTNFWFNERWSVRLNLSWSEDSRGLGAGVAWRF